MIVNHIQLECLFGAVDRLSSTTQIDKARTQIADIMAANKNRYHRRAVTNVSVERST